MTSDNQWARGVARGTIGAVELCGIADGSIQAFSTCRCPAFRQRFTPHVAGFFLIEISAIAGDSIGSFSQCRFKQELPVPTGNLIVRTIQNVASACLNVAGENQLRQRFADSKSGQLSARRDISREITS
ncbi:CDP-archaeol synthase [bacterium]|nr:CDP-archaeol synthase [bacterium]